MTDTADRSPDPSSSAAAKERADTPGGQHRDEARPDDRPTDTGQADYGSAGYEAAAGLAEDGSNDGGQDEGAQVADANR